MASDVVKVVQQAGLVEKDTLEELRRWGSPVPSVPEGPEVPPEIIPSLIERALQQQDFVQVRETDLGVLQQYLSTQETGSLKVEDLVGRVAYADVVFGRTPQREYIVPWLDDKISEVLEDCVVSLHAPDEGWVPLINPRELYYGERKMFTIWGWTKE